MALSGDIQPYGLSADVTEKGHPSLPVIRIESPPRRASTDDEACPSPVVRKYEGARTTARNTRSRIPPFQQSKRWTKAHGTEPSSQPTSQHKQSRPSGALSAGADDVALTMREASFEQQRAQMRKTTSPAASPRLGSSEDQSADAPDVELTRREASMEQQRAELKKPVVEKTDKEDVVRPRTVSHSSAEHLSGGLCPATTCQCWRRVKARVRRRSARRKATPTRHRDFRIRRASDRLAGPSKGRPGTHARPRSHIAATKQLPRLPDGAQSKDRLILQQKPSRSPSPVPSLHDPEKDVRFSEECRRILRSLDFDRDWLLPAASILPAVSPRPRADFQPQSPEMRDVSRHDTSTQDVDGIDARRPQSNVTLTKVVPSETTPQRQEPPARASSRTVNSLIHMMQLTRPKLFTNSTVAGSQPALISDNRPRRSASTSKLSDFPTPGPSHRSPRSAKSTDTLAKIEAQVQSVHYSNLDAELQKGAHTRSDSRSSDPPSTPPERPLPALPAGVYVGAGGTASQNPGPRGSQDDGSRRGSSSRIHIVANPSPPASISERDPPENLSASPKHSTELTSSRSPRPQESRSSLNSARSSARHSICGPRADKVKEKRLRDLASCRSKSKSPLSDHPVGSDSTPGLSTMLPATGKSSDAIDQLDQFPAVPSPRRTSIVAGLAGQFDPASPVHQLIRPSSPHHRTGGPSQVLGQSNIFVVVDLDPVTARFRAGAMSPAPSIGGGSSVYARKHARGPSSLREVHVTNQGSPVKAHKKSMSLASAQDMLGGSARLESGPARKSKRSARSNSIQPSSSSDESRRPGPPGSPSPSKKSLSRPLKRRRWNSTDISMVQTLQRDLEDYYGTILKQEERIKWQAGQLRMMIRVIAPMNEVRGIKTPTIPLDRGDNSTEDEDGYFSQQFAMRISSGVKPRKQPKASPIGKVGREKISKPVYTRYNSGGNISTASATATASTDSKASADDASLTDPVEYDLPTPSAELKVEPLHVNKGNWPASAEAPKVNLAGGKPVFRVPLHPPPPVSQTVSRSRLSQEASLTSSSPLGYGPSQPPALPTHVEEVGNRAGRPRNPRRVSADRVFSSTEQMDHAIAQFNHAG